MDHKSDCLCWRCWLQDQTDKAWLLLLFAGFIVIILFKSADPSSRELVAWAENLAYGVMGALLTLITSRQKSTTSPNIAVDIPNSSKPSTTTATVTTSSSGEEEEKK